MAAGSVRRRCLANRAAAQAVGPPERQGPQGCDTTAALANADDGVEIAERWAAELGLAGPTDELGGFRSWTGTVSTFRIEVFVRTADDDHL